MLFWRSIGIPVNNRGFLNVEAGLYKAWRLKDARKQSTVLNGEYSLWTRVKAGVPQRSILGTLFFLIFINDLSDNLVSNPKLFANNTSLFVVVPDITLSAMNLNDDLKKIN